MVESIFKHGKRGAAYVFVGVFEITLGFVLALKAPGSMSGFATILGAVNVALYGGGALAKWAEGGKNDADIR